MSNILSITSVSQKRMWDLCLDFVGDNLDYVELTACAEILNIPASTGHFDSSSKRTESHVLKLKGLIKKEETDF